MGGIESKAKIKNQLEEHGTQIKAGEQQKREQDVQLQIGEMARKNYENWSALVAEEKKRFEELHNKIAAWQASVREQAKVENEEMEANAKIGSEKWLKEEIIKNMRLQSERKGKKKLKYSARELFVTERCLEKIRTELLEVLRNRYRTWKLENSMENRTAVLFHFTKIEHELNHFERRIIQRYLENEEENDAGEGEKKELKTEKLWKKCDKNLDYHRKNVSESIEEAKTVSENIDKILRSDEKLELMVASGIKNFMKMSDEVLQKNRELIGDLQVSEGDVVSTEILNRKNDIVRIFEQASVTLAETSMMHRKLTLLPRDFSLEISQTLLARISDLLEISSDIFEMLQVLNNHQNLKARTNMWKERISETFSALTDIHMLIPNFCFQQNQLKQIKNLLTRVEHLHRPSWYFQFVEAVGGNAIEEIRQFRANMQKYTLSAEELFTDIEQFLGY